MLKLIHYSAQYDLGALADTPQVLDSIKPRGMWVTPASGMTWPKWCRAERFRPQDLEWAHELGLMPNAQMLWLRTVAEIETFSRRWVRRGELSNILGSRKHMLPDWKALSRQYDGIVISPYQWECRFEPWWYYSWDCASGCIWNAKSAIAHITTTHSGIKFEGSQPFDKRQLARMRDQLDKWNWEGRPNG